MADVIPDDGMSSSDSSGLAGPLSYLSGEWINERVVNVTKKVNSLLDRLIDDGLLGSGYFPFDQPITNEMLQRMSPEEFRALYDSLASLEAKSELTQRMEVLKLPPRELLPKPERARYPVSPPVAGITRPEVDSGSSV